MQPNLTQYTRKRNERTRGTSDHERRAETRVEGGIDFATNKETLFIIHVAQYNTAHLSPD